ncbi:homocitrate synthase [Burkholderia ambifaria]|uniref:LeuA family protein n=1 Tax=Burkholderia ambifaria TaxID=152480 RepID=UPI0013FE4434|nr:homocitrate synthase [Burkholderia ambifaria]NHL65988.1 homocitrate synthase [Burkholderia ambifaria]
MKQNSITLVDCTLREGNQSPGIRFTAVDSIKIAKQLSDIGVDCIEVGHPYASEWEFHRVAAVRDALPKQNILAHARARIEDIESVAKSGASTVGIFAGVNDYSQKYRLEKSLPEIMKIIGNSVSHAKSLGLGVRYTAEDSSRTTFTDLTKAYTIALEHGADRICFADSVGCLDPEGMTKIISNLSEKFTNIPLEVHCHDDRGLALANALSAISAGASHVSCSVNGIGERSGITDTCTLIANLSYLGQLANVKPERIMELSNEISKITNSWPDAWRPVVGKNSFTHTSKLHVAASTRNSECYHWIEPGKIGRSSTLL